VLGRPIRHLVHSASFGLLRIVGWVYVLRFADRSDAHVRFGGAMCTNRLSSLRHIAEWTLKGRGGVHHESAR
jgi:hypothetical protein